MIRTSVANRRQATYYMATAMSDWSMPTWKLIFNAGSQLHVSKLVTLRCGIHSAQYALDMFETC